VVKIRLARHGNKKNPIYRVVVADSREPRDGKTLETIGRYNPQHDPSLIEIDADKARAWLGKGAQPTDQVAKLLKILKIEKAEPAGKA
jgi:small subunit ribosomal protein S16